MMFTSSALASALPASRRRRRWRPRPPGLRVALAWVRLNYGRSLVIDARVRAARERTLARHGRSAGDGGRDA